MDLQTFIVNFTSFMNLVVQFLLGLAFALFVFNAIRFFVFQSNNEDGRERAKNLATYSIGAFILLIVFWGIINLLTSSLFGENIVDCTESTTSDYIYRGSPCASPG